MMTRYGSTNNAVTLPISANLYNSKNSISSLNEVTKVSYRPPCSTLFQRNPISKSNIFYGFFFLILFHQGHSSQNSNNKSHRKKKPHKSESEEYDSLGSDTESGSGGRTRNRMDQSIHLDELEPPSFISML